MTEDKEIQSRARMSVETSLLITRLRQIKEGEFVTYEELGEFAGMSRPPHSGNRPEYDRLRSATEHLESYSISFSPIRADEGIHGIKRLNVSESVGKNTDRIGRLGKRGKKIARKSASLDVEKMDTQTKIQHFTNITQAKFFEAIASKKGQERLQGIIEQSGPKVVSFSDTLKAFESQRAAGKM